MRKRIIAVAAITAVTVMNCGCSAKKNGSSKNKDIPEKPAEWVVEQRKVEDITPLEGEAQIYVKRDAENEDMLRLVQGVLADRVINNEYEALDLIAEYSQELGIVDAYSELKYKDIITYGDKMNYRFEQYCDDIKVKDSFVEITVDTYEGNKPEILNSTYTDLWGFDTKPVVSSSAAVKCAKDKYKTEKNTVPELMVISGPQLAWRVPVKNDKIAEVYISAVNGDIIAETEIVTQ